MGYLRHTTNRHRKGHRTNGYPNDVMCSDGVMDYGWRKVRRGGIVKAYSVLWQDDKLIPFENEFVVVNSVDVYCTEIDVFKDYPTAIYRMDFICRIK